MCTFLVTILDGSVNNTNWSGHVTHGGKPNLRRKYWFRKPASEIFKIGWIDTIKYNSIEIVF